MAMAWTPMSRVGAVERLTEEFRKRTLLHIDTRGKVETNPGIYFGVAGLRRVWSGRLINPDETHWAPVSTIFEAGYSWKLKEVHPHLALRMRDLRRCGIAPSHAAKLVLEHYYREG